MSGPQDYVRYFGSLVARALNKKTNGKLSPHLFTGIGAGLYVITFLLLMTQRPVWAGLTLVLAGCCDLLDGALARTQKRETTIGLWLDASFDRFGEILTFGGLGYYLISQDAKSGVIVLLFLAFGFSFLSSYMKSKAEAVVASKDVSSHRLNRRFDQGPLSFGWRIIILASGLIIGMPGVAIYLILVLAVITCLRRGATIINALRT